MMSITISDQYALLSFWLVFTRWLAMMINFPVFEHNSIPSLLKVMMALLVSYIFFPVLKDPYVQLLQTYGVDHIGWLTIVEVLTGLAIGLMVSLLMSIYIAAGSIISQQIGFSAVRYFDPNSAIQVGPFEIFLRWSLTIMVISSGALLPMFKGALLSFQKISLFSLGQVSWNPEFFLMFFKNLFIASLLLASPLIFSNLIIMCIMGVIARTVPQMNVLMVSFVVNIGTGLFVIFITSSELFHQAFRLYTQNLALWFKFVT